MIVRYMNMHDPMSLLQWKGNYRYCKHDIADW